MWQVEDWFWQDTSLSSCFCWRQSGKGKKLFFLPLPPPKIIETVYVYHFQGSLTFSALGELKHLFHDTGPITYSCLSCPICKMCRAPPCFASTNHHDPSLDSQVRRGKYHSAKSRRYETMKTRTKCHGSLTSQHWTDLAQNAAHPTLHFCLVQPSGCQTAADITMGRSLNQSIFKAL